MELSNFLQLFPDSRFVGKPESTSNQGGWIAEVSYAGELHKEAVSVQVSKADDGIEPQFIARFKSAKGCASDVCVVCFEEFFTDESLVEFCVNVLGADDGQ